ncbi:MAG: hypothetical protein CMJ23_09725 [Phycisphaerae bacterium]|nr:hypothetical protein [Phycisphaerae bacterium]
MMAEGRRENAPRWGTSNVGDSSRWVLDGCETRAHQEISCPVVGTLHGLRAILDLGVLVEEGVDGGVMGWGIFGCIGRPGFSRDAL